MGKAPRQIVPERLVKQFLVFRLGGHRATPDLVGKMRPHIPPTPTFSEEFGAWFRRTATTAICRSICQTFSGQVFRFSHDGTTWQGGITEPEFWREIQPSITLAPALFSWKLLFGQEWKEHEEWFKSMTVWDFWLTCLIHPAFMSHVRPSWVYRPQGPFAVCQTATSRVVRVGIGGESSERTSESPGREPRRGTEWLALLWIWRTEPQMAFRPNWGELLDHPGQIPFPWRFLLIELFADFCVRFLAEYDRLVHRLSQPEAPAAPAHWLRPQYQALARDEAGRVANELAVMAGRLPELAAFERAMEAWMGEAACGYDDATHLRSCGIQHQVWEKLANARAALRRLPDFSGPSGTVPAVSPTLPARPE